MCQEEENKKLLSFRDIELITVERFHDKTTCCDLLLLSDHLNRTSTPLSPRKPPSVTYLSEDEIDTEGAYLKFCYTIENRPLHSEGVRGEDGFLKIADLQSGHLRPEQFSWTSKDECEEANLAAIGSEMNFDEAFKEVDLGIVTKYDMNKTILEDLCMFYEHLKKKEKKGKDWKVKMKLLLMLLAHTMKKLFQQRYKKKSKFGKVVNTLKQGIFI